MSEGILSSVRAGIAFIAVGEDGKGGADETSGLKLGI